MSLKIDVYKIIVHSFNVKLVYADAQRSRLGDVREFIARPPRPGCKLKNENNIFTKIIIIKGQPVTEAPHSYQSLYNIVAARILPNRVLCVRHFTQSIMLFVMTRFAY